jgi:hypothetical protein
MPLGARRIGVCQSGCDHPQTSRQNLRKARHFAAPALKPTIESGLLNLAEQAIDVQRNWLRQLRLDANCLRAAFGLETA